MKRLLALLLSCVGCTQAPERAKAPEQRTAPAVAEWEHGFRTDYVTATRYKGSFGFTIGFCFPKNIYNYDSPEVYNWFAKYDGFVLDFGGAPGAEVIVKFKDVADKESANAKLAVVMPDLTEFMKTVK